MSNTNYEDLPVFVEGSPIIIESSNLSNNIKKNSGGRPLSEVWGHFLKGSELKNNKGHFSAKCNYCFKKYDVGYPHILESHLDKFYLDLIVQKQKKKFDNQQRPNQQKPNKQTSLSEFYKSTTLTKDREY